MDIHNEIQQSMGSTLDDSLDDTALDEELNELLKPREVNTSDVNTPTPKKSLKNILKDDSDEELLAQLEKLEIETELPTSSKTSVKTSLI